MNEKELEERLIGLYRILLGMNALGTLDLADLFVIENYYKSAFNFDTDKISL